MTSSIYLKGVHALKEDSEAKNEEVRVSKARKGVETAGSESDMTEKRPGIFVRISPNTKDILELAAKGRTYADVIENLLEYFHGQEAGLQEKILKGQHINPLKESENLLAQLSRAQHAYEEKRYYYAVQTYTTLLTDHAGGSKDLLEFCKYRLGHCWISLAYDLRYEALGKLSQGPETRTEVDLYTIALQALDAALDNLTEVTDDKGNLTSLIAHYNIACCCSLKAQYMVEAKIDRDTESNHGRLLRMVADKQWLETQDVWNTIGEDWRQKYGPDEDVVDWGNKALTELREIYSAQSEAESNPSQGDTIWIVEMANRDADFIFLRADMDCKPKFKEWSTLPVARDNSIAKPVKQLLREHRLRRSPTKSQE